MATWVHFCSLIHSTSSRIKAGHCAKSSSHLPFRCWVEKYPMMVRAIAAARHEIGNHTYSHPHLNRLNEAEIQVELERVGVMIFDLTGQQPNLFR
ncbi:MAG TPA: hypothetical protein DCQ14_00665 [Firmicutes bacterium]|nr:hypothetical protein [Bacillota bacterium]